VKAVFHNLLERFVRPRFGTDVRPNASEVPLAQLKREADEAAHLLRSDAYVAAYQRTLDKLVTDILTADIGTAEGRERALALIARAQQHQSIAQELSATVNRYTYESTRRATLARDLPRAVS
jgi:hypothetical protein